MSYSAPASSNNENPYNFNLWAMLLLILLVYVLQKMM